MSQGQNPALLLLFLLLDTLSNTLLALPNALCTMHYALAQCIKAETYGNLVAHPVRPLNCKLRFIVKANNKDHQSLSNYTPCVKAVYHRMGAKNDIHSKDYTNTHCMRS